MKLDDQALNVVVDGSSFQGPRRGGIGVRYLWIDEDGSEVFEDDLIASSFPGATNNQMELQAPIEVLRRAVAGKLPSAAGHRERIVFHSDSRYLTDGVGTAIYLWSRNGWKLAAGGPVQNADQWKELLRLMRRLNKESFVQVRFEWVPGKSDRHTKDVDKMAKAGAQGPAGRVIQHQRVRRKLSPQSVEPGSVTMRGQTELIRIIDDKYLKVQRLYYYRYEVVDPDSKDHLAVDFASSELMLRGAGHTYQVVFNDDTRDPRIVDAAMVDDDPSPNLEPNE